MLPQIGLRALLVEPDDDFRYVFALLLEMMGHTVVTTNNAAEALKKVKVFVPDVVLIELALEDTRGLRLARQLRQLSCVERVGLVAITAYPTANSEVMALEAGFDRFLSKPVPMHRISEVLQSLRTATGRLPNGWLH